MKMNTRGSYYGALAIYHLAFSVLYWRLLQPGSDVEKYLRWAAEGLRPGWIGSPFIVNFIELFPHALITQYELVLYLVFSLVGLAGFILLDLAFSGTRNAQSDPTVWILRALLLLPSLHLWSAAIGKDAFAMLAIGAFVFGMLHERRYEIAAPAGILLAGILIMWFVRPHVGYLMLVSWILFALCSRKWIAAALATIALAALTPIVLDYTGLPSIAELFSYIIDRQSKNQGGSTSFNFSATDLIGNIVRYFIMPLSADGMFGVIAGLNNMIIWMFLVGLFLPKLLNWRRLLTPEALALLAFAGTTTLILTMTTANYGIAMRQKAMIIPVLLAFCTIAASQPILTRDRNAKTVKNQNLS